MYRKPSLYNVVGMTTTTLKMQVIVLYKYDVFINQLYTEIYTIFTKKMLFSLFINNYFKY